MPTLAQQNDPNNQGSTEGGSAYLGSGSGGPTTGVKDPSSPSMPTGYTNLQDYLSANQGNDTQMGQAVAGQVGVSGGLAQNYLNALQNQASTEINAGTNNLNQDTLQGISQYNPLGTGLEQNGVQMAQAGTKLNPLGTITNTWSRDYSGPQAYTDGDLAPLAQTASQDVGNAQLVANQLNNYQGISALLQAAYNQPGYSAGENNLDAALTQTGAGGQQQLQNAQQQWGGIGNTAKSEYSDIGNQIQAGKDTTDATNTAYQNAVDATNQGINQVNSEWANAYKPVSTGSTHPVGGAHPLTISTHSGPTYAGGESSNPVAQAGTALGQAAAGTAQTLGQGVQSWAAYGGKIPGQYQGINNMIHVRNKK